MPLILVLLVESYVLGAVHHAAPTPLLALGVVHLALHAAAAAGARRAAAPARCVALGAVTVGAFGLVAAAALVELPASALLASAAILGMCGVPLAIALRPTPR